MKMFHGSCSDQRLLRIIQYIGQCILSDWAKQFRVKINSHIDWREWININHKTTTKEYHSKLVVCNIYSHCLFSHSRLICVTWGLIAQTKVSRMNQSIQFDKKMCPSYTDLPDCDQEMV